MQPPPLPHRILLGDNNIWPFALDASAGGGWLLVDAGVDYDDGAVSTWTLLVEQARALGFTPRDVRTVVVTHEHIDHAGLAARWAAEGARIVAMRAAIPALYAGRDGLEAQRAARLDELRRHGCPEAVIARLPAWRGGRALRWEPCPAGAIDAAEERAVHRLADGRTLRLLAAPGHTPGNLVAYVAREGEAGGDLCSGDTLLPTTVPSPGLQFPGIAAHVVALRGAPSADAAATNAATAAAVREPSLPPFLRSVAALAALDVRRILPGHGEAVADPARLFAQFTAHHERRARRVRAHLAAAAAANGTGGADGGGGCTAYEIARGLFPRLPAERMAQAMTEVIGHLDRLEEQGVARRVPETPSARATSPAVPAAPWRYRLLAGAAAAGGGS